MKNIVGSVKACLVALAIAAAAPAAMAVNEVINPGFEENSVLLPSLFGWSASTVTQEFSGRPPSTYAAVFDYTATPSATLSQGFSLYSGANYSFEFYLQLEMDCPAISTQIACFATNPIADLKVTVGGTDITSFAPSQVSSNWVKYSTVLSGFGGDGSLPLEVLFRYTSSTDFDLLLDDVSIDCQRVDKNGDADCEPPTNNAPEPGSLLLVGAALAAGALVRRRKQQG